jgi:transposase
VQAIKLIDAGKSAYKVAEDFGVGKTQIQSLRKRNAEVLNDFENNVSGSTKHYDSKHFSQILRYSEHFVL